jgi:hypothetical protein
VSARVTLDDVDFRLQFAFRGAGDAHAKVAGQVVVSELVEFFEVELHQACLRLQIKDHSSRKQGMLTHARPAPQGPGLQARPEAQKVDSTD